MSSERLAWIVAAALAVLALLQSLRLAIVRGAAARRLRLARERGRAGERAALALVEREGYRIEALQPALDWTIAIDGEALKVALRADLLVSRAGRRFVAEVKTGTAARLDVPATRRQLLEYSVAYAVDGALLVDVERERIHEIAFPHPRSRRGGVARLLGTALALAAAAWLIGLYLARR